MATRGSRRKSAPLREAGLVSSGVEEPLHPRRELGFRRSDVAPTCHLRHRTRFRVSGDLDLLDHPVLEVRLAVGGRKEADRYIGTRIEVEHHSGNLPR